MGDSSNYLLEGMNVSVLRFDGRVIGVGIAQFRQPDHQQM